MANLCHESRLFSKSSRWKWEQFNGVKNNKSFVFAKYDKVLCRKNSNWHRKNFSSQDCSSIQSAFSDDDT